MISLALVDNFLNYLTLCDTTCFGSAMGSGDLGVVVVSPQVNCMKQVN